MRIDFAIARRSRPSQDGSAVVIILVLLFVMVVLAAANTATLNRLRARVKLIDQRETRRLQTISTGPPLTK
jgi:type II secretory pathway component PulK